MEKVISELAWGRKCDRYVSVTTCNSPTSTYSPSTRMPGSAFRERAQNSRRAVTSPVPSYTTIDFSWMQRIVITIYLALFILSGNVRADEGADHFQLLTEAAERGDAEAQYNLGVNYETGQDIPQDYEVAVKWFTLAAEQGHASAQFSLGGSYYKGQGVPQDYKAAVKWYRLAAEQGNADAQAVLGGLYYLGEVVPRDYKAAEKWLTLAIEQPDVSDPDQAKRKLKLSLMLIMAKAAARAETTEE